MDELKERQQLFRDLLSAYRVHMVETLDGGRHSYGFVESVIRFVSETGDVEVGRRLIEADRSLTSTPLGAKVLSIAEGLISDRTVNRSFIDAEILEGIPVFYFSKKVSGGFESLISEKLGEHGDVDLLAKPKDEIFEGVFSDVYVFQLRPKNKVNESTDFINEADSDYYGRWVERVSYFLRQKTGNQLEDYPRYDFNEAYARGELPRVAAMKAIQSTHNNVFGEGVDDFGNNDELDEELGTEEKWYWRVDYWLRHKTGNQMTDYPRYDFEAAFARGELPKVAAIEAIQTGLYDEGDVPDAVAVAPKRITKEHAEECTLGDDEVDAVFDASLSLESDKGAQLKEALIESVSSGSIPATSVRNTMIRAAAARGIDDSEKLLPSILQSWKTFLGRKV